MPQMHRAPYAPDAVSRAWDAIETGVTVAIACVLHRQRARSEPSWSENRLHPAIAIGAGFHVLDRLARSVGARCVPSAKGGVDIVAGPRAKPVSVDAL